MKKVVYVVVSVSLILCVGTVCCLHNTVIHKETASVSGSKNSCVIVIDPGHGGIDGGAVGADGTVEKGINLSIAGYLRDILGLYGFKTVMTRTDDRLIFDEGITTIRRQKTSDIKNRMKLLDSFDDSVLLSIHQNKFSSNSFSGAQVFYSKNNSTSSVLADLIQKSIVSKLQHDNIRRIKASGKEIYLLYNSKKTAVMVECGFMSNKKELMLLKDDNYQYKMAFSIACGIIGYMNVRNNEVENGTKQK